MLIGSFSANPRGIAALPDDPLKKISKDNYCGFVYLHKIFTYTLVKPTTTTILTYAAVNPCFDFIPLNLFLLSYPENLSSLSVVVAGSHFLH